MCEKAITLQTQHLSHYQLTLEPNTPFGRESTAAAGRRFQPGTCKKPVRHASRRPDSRNTRYRPTRAAGRECAHNLNYWNFGDYLGIGASTHGKATHSDGAVHRRWKIRAPRGYLERAATPRRIGGDDAIAREQMPFEFMLNALRLNAGFDLTDFCFARRTRPGDAIASTFAECAGARLAAGARRRTGYARRIWAGGFSTM